MHYPSSVIRSLLCLSTAVVLISAGQQSCYFTNGNIAEDDTPCTNVTMTGGGAVPCCGSGRTCLANRLCSGVDGEKTFLSRGSCTDSTWKDENCPQVCLDYYPGARVTNCTYAKGISNSNNSVYCCAGTDDEPTCCNDADDYLLIPNVNDTPVTASSSSSTKLSVTTDTSLAEEATTSTSASSITSTNYSTTNTASDTTTSAATSTTADAAADTTVSTSPQKSSQDASSSQTGIGLGLGLGLGIPLLAALIAGPIFWRRYHHSRHQPEAAEMRPAGAYWSTIHSNTGSSSDTNTHYNGDRKRPASPIHAPIEMNTINSPSELPGSEVLSDRRTRGTDPYNWDDIKR